MKLFVGGRQAGKTTKLVEWLLEDESRFLLTPYNVDHIRSIVTKVLSRNREQEPVTQRLIELAMRRVYTLDDMFMNRCPLEREQVWAVDDLDALLRQLVSGRVEQATHGADLQVQDVQA